VKVWFDEQVLGDGGSYKRRAEEFAQSRRRELRRAVVDTLKAINERSYTAAKVELDKLTEDGTVSDLQRHWIVNGFSCTVTREGLDALKAVTGVKKIFAERGGGAGGGRVLTVEAPEFAQAERAAFDAAHYQHPWYSRYLLADKVWREFAVTGQGTLNVVHDFNFLFSGNVTDNLYQEMQAAKQMADAAKAEEIVHVSPATIRRLPARLPFLFRPAPASQNLLCKHRL
jgi:hypothetical protein